MIRLQVLDHLPLVHALVEARITEPNRKCREIVDVMTLDERCEDR
jgi:hypothetical protein